MKVSKKGFDEKLLNHILGCKLFKFHIIVLTMKDFLEIHFVSIESQKIKQNLLN